jgi:hypothetical protein
MSTLSGGQHSCPESKGAPSGWFALAATALIRPLTPPRKYRANCRFRDRLETGR